MITIDDEFLASVGMGNLQEESKAKAIDDIVYLLNNRVGERLSTILDEKQMDVLDKMMDGKSDQGDKLGAWLNENVPNYSKIVEEELEKLKDEWAKDEI